MPLFGTPVTRTEDQRMLTVGGTYVADIDLPGAVHVTYVTSTAPHARIVAIDTAAASHVPGVLGVFTAADLDVGPYPPIDPSLPTMVRPLLAGDVVRFVGEPVVAIVSETRAAGADAADEVIVDLDTLPAVVDMGDSLAGEVVLFPDTGSNLV